MIHNKRYMVLFHRWSEKIFNEDKEEFDKLNDAFEHSKLIDEIYDDLTENDRYGYPIHSGYIIIDFIEERIVKWSKSKKIYFFNNKSNPLYIKDKLFRGENEIPKGYVFDIGEYEGWLQYRWGDGKNAINYEKKKEKNKNDKILVDNENNLVDYNESIQDEFNREIEKEKINIKINKW